MNLEGAEEILERLVEFIPQQYGDAVGLYPWIECEGHEWDNRTTLENVEYFFMKLREKAFH